MATLTDFTPPPLWVGVRHKAEYRFRIQMFTGTIADAEFRGAEGIVALGTTGAGLEVAPGDTVVLTWTNTGTPDIDALKGTYEVQGYTDEGPGVNGFPYITPDTPFAGTTTVEITVTAYSGQPVSGQLYASHPADDIPDETHLKLLATLRPVRPVVGSYGYYTINVAEYLKARIFTVPEDMVTPQSKALWTPYSLQCTQGVTDLATDIMRYAVDSAMEDPLYPFPTSTIPLSPFIASNQFRPYWEGYLDIYSFVSATPESVNTIIEIPDPDTINFPPQPCPKYPVQILWRNPQGGWSYWIYGYDHETNHAVGEPYFWRDSNGIDRHGSRKVQKGMVLRSGYVTDPVLLAGLRTIRYTQVNAYIMEYATPGDLVPAITFIPIIVNSNTYQDGRMSDKLNSVDIEITFAKEVAG